MQWFVSPLTEWHFRRVGVKFEIVKNHPLNKMLMTDAVIQKNSCRLGDARLIDGNVEKYAEFIRRGAPVSMPVIVASETEPGRDEFIDGNHRGRALEQAGITHIDAYRILTKNALLIKELCQQLNSTEGEGLRKETMVQHALEAMLTNGWNVPEAARRFLLSATTLRKAKDRLDTMQRAKDLNVWNVLNSTQFTDTHWVSIGKLDLDRSFVATARLWRRYPKLLNIKQFGFVIKAIRDKRSERAQLAMIEAQGQLCEEKLRAEIPEGGPTMPVVQVRRSKEVQVRARQQSLTDAFENCKAKVKAAKDPKTLALEPEGMQTFLAPWFAIKELMKPFEKYAKQ